MWPKHKGETPARLNTQKLIIVRLDSHIPASCVKKGWHTDNQHRADGQFKSKTRSGCFPKLSWLVSKLNNWDSVDNINLQSMKKKRKLSHTFIGNVIITTHSLRQLFITLLFCLSSFVFTLFCLSADVLHLPEIMWIEFTTEKHDRWLLVALNDSGCQCTAQHPENNEMPWQPSSQFTVTEVNALTCTMQMTVESKHFRNDIYIYLYF